MALLTSSNKKQQGSLKVSIDQMTLKKIESYIQFAGIESLDEFLEKASEFVFAKDKEWQEIESFPVSQAS